MADAEEDRRSRAREERRARERIDRAIARGEGPDGDLADPGAEERIRRSREEGGSRT